MRRSGPLQLVAVALAAAPLLPGQASPDDRRAYSVPPWLARAISADYRSLDDRVRRLHSELRTLAEAPKNERGARVGWKVFGYSHALSPEQWIEIDLGAVHGVDAVCLVPVDVPSPRFGRAGPRISAPLSRRAGRRPLGPDGRGRSC
jgi:hypothetical protein